MPQSSLLTYRRIDLNCDAELAVSHHRDACIATFGDDSRWEGAERYLRHLRATVEEFPDGCVLAMLRQQCIGQLELEVPYGSGAGYVNLYYVTPSFRGLGFGRQMNDYSERYFRSWEASRIELHVSRTNERALNFYRRLGYRLTQERSGSLWQMTKDLSPVNSGKATQK